MLTRGTIGVLPHGNIILSHNNIPMVPRVNTLLCDKMVGWWVPLMPSLHHMYTHTPKYALYTPPGIRIHIHELHEFEPKTLWKLPNVLATKLHNSLLVGLCNILFYFVNYEIVWKSQLWHFFIIIGFFKWNK